MSWRVKNDLGLPSVKVRRGFWSSDPISSRGGEYKSDQTSWFVDGLDITVEGVSGYFWEIAHNPVLIRTNVSTAKNTVVTLLDGGPGGGTYRIRIHITDDNGRNERSELEIPWGK